MCPYNILVGKLKDVCIPIKLINIENGNIKPKDWGEGELLWIFDYWQIPEALEVIAKNKIIA